MTYIKTKLKRSIDIDAIITLHYFEYMKNFEFSKPEISSFTNQMNSMRSNPSEKTLRIW